MGAFAAYSISQ